jgi:hypothetical protein
MVHMTQLKPLEPVRYYLPVDDATVLKVLNGLPSGVYASKALHERYVALAPPSEVAGMQPASVQKFGARLRELGFKPVHKHGVRSWVINNRQTLRLVAELAEGYQR